MSLYVKGWSELNWYTYLTVKEINLVKCLCQTRRLSDHVCVLGTSSQPLVIQFSDWSLVQFLRCDTPHPSAIFFQNSIFNVSYDMSRVVEVVEFSHPLRLPDTWSDVSPENSIYQALNTINLSLPTINCGSHDIAQNGWTSATNQCFLRYSSEHNKMIGYSASLSSISVTLIIIP